MSVWSRASKHGRAGRSGGLKVRIPRTSFEVGKTDRRFKLAHLRPERLAESYEIRLLDEGEICESVMGMDGDDMVILMNNHAVSRRDKLRCRESIDASVSLGERDSGEYESVISCAESVWQGIRFLIYRNINGFNQKMLCIIITDEEDLSLPMVVSKQPELQIIGKWDIFLISSWQEWKNTWLISLLLNSYC